MNAPTLTARQRRELEFYEEYSRRNGPDGVSFEAATGVETRPWNAYWFVCQLARDQYAKGARTLLDVGCGPGSFSVLFAKMGYNVSAFDISPNNIAIARSFSARHNVADRTHFSVGVAERLEYRANSFDVIVGINILHHVEIRKVVSNCLRVLKREGIAIFKEPIEVPGFDAVRNSRLGTWIVPKTASFERHCTEDERKLTGGDLAFIEEVCSRLSAHHFRLVSRVAVLTRYGRTMLERVDRQLFQALPFLRQYGGEIVLSLSKEG